MSDKKILSINMNEFTFSNNKTKKTQPKKNPQDKIRIKSPSNKKPQTLRKQSLLNMIRKQQEDRYKRLYSNSQQPVQSIQPHTQNNNVDKFNADFDNSSRAYLDRLIKKHEMNVPKNTTLRRYPPIEPSRIQQSENYTQQPITNNINSTPKYGCLKNGSLPTYRNYLNKTQNNRPTIQVGNNVPLNSNIQNVTNNAITSQQPPVSVYEKNENNTPSIIESQINDGMKRMSELKQRNDILSKLSNTRPKKLKRKRTLRRTYKVGRSQSAPKVSVLVSNKTIRNRISTKKQLLKQTPIQDVKKYLIKHGLIRIGSITPNDVLRKMYESLSLVCGEVHNHNPDTLLYNYINSNE